MDIIEGLPWAEGYSSLLVVVDCLSKYAHLICLKHPYSAQTVAAIFAKEIIRLHGVPISMIFDRDRFFSK